MTMLEKITISSELAHFLGCSEDTKISRLEIVKRICIYVAQNNLQNPNHRSEIFPDKTLQLLFNLDPAIKNSISYSEIQSLLRPHLLTPIKIHSRKFRHVMTDLSSFPKSQSSRRDLRRLARNNPGVLYTDSSDSEDESNYRNVTSRSLL